MPKTERAPEEITVLGQAIYDQKIREKVEPQHQGQFLVLDIDSGEFVIADTDASATRELLASHPDGVRIGADAAYRFGGFRKVQNR